MRFWDSSAILPLIIEELSTPKLVEIVTIDQDLWVWWGAYLECHTALARRLREGSLNLEDRQFAAATLAELADNWHEIQPSDVVRDLAIRLVSTHALRSADALQLAAALIACEGQPRDQYFITLDNRLAYAAALEGFRVPFAA